MTLVIKVLGKKNKKTILLVALSRFVNQNIGIIIAINSISENIENYTAKDETKTTMVPAKKNSKKYARSGDTGGKDIKRQRTDTTASVNKECHNNNNTVDDPSHQDYSHISLFPLTDQRALPLSLSLPATSASTSMITKIYQRLSNYQRNSVK